MKKFFKSSDDIINSEYLPVKLQIMLAIFVSNIRRATEYSLVYTFSNSQAIFINLRRSYRKHLSSTIYLQVYSL